MEKFKIDINERKILNKGRGFIYLYGSSLREYLDETRRRSGRRDVDFITTLSIDVVRDLLFDGFFVDENYIYSKCSNWKRRIVFTKDIVDYMNENELSIDRIAYNGRDIKMGLEFYKVMKNKYIKDKDIISLSEENKIYLLDIICNGYYDANYDKINKLFDADFFKNNRKEIFKKIVEGFIDIHDYILPLIYTNFDFEGDLFDIIFNIVGTNSKKLQRTITYLFSSNLINDDLFLEKYQRDIINKNIDIIVLSLIYYFNFFDISESFKNIDNDLEILSELNITGERLNSLKRIIYYLDKLSKADIYIKDVLWKSKYSLSNEDFILFNVVNICICQLKRDRELYRMCINNLKNI